MTDIHRSPLGLGVLGPLPRHTDIARRIDCVKHMMSGEVQQAFFKVTVQV